jgi:hypothetical protein
MNFLVFSLLFFFSFLIIYQIYLHFLKEFKFDREGLTPMDPNVDASGNTFSLTDLGNQVQDLSGNVGDLQSQVYSILQSQSAYLSKNAPVEPDISLKAVS